VFHVPRRTRRFERKLHQKFQYRRFGAAGAARDDILFDLYRVETV
jgi:hypothetical protein